MISFISGDVLQTNAQYIAQGVARGSQEGLGTGLALKISKRWPDAQKKFKKFTFNQKFEGGDVFVVEPETDRLGIIYIATQPDMYHATLPLLNKGLRNLAIICQKKEIVSVGLPKIGAGLGKLDWESEVKPLMVEHLQDSETEFYVYEDFRNEHELEPEYG
ncbi:MAG: macro domain-containing protein [Acidobacteria bacterium]|nr:macro domain-containing protein [Acidobacteriota bacterium]